MYAAVQKWPLVSATKTSRRARHICNRIVNGIGSDSGGEVALERDGEAIQIRKVEIWRRTAHSDVKLLQVLAQIHLRIPHLLRSMPTWTN